MRTDSKRIFVFLNQLRPGRWADAEGERYKALFFWDGNCFNSEYGA